jgi:hypothetical protein
MPKNGMRADPFHEWDFAVAKNWKLRERYGIQFRAEFFNVLNQRTFAIPSGGNPATPATFAVVTSEVNSVPVIGSGVPRETQLSLKLSF